MKTTELFYTKWEDIPTRHYVAIVGYLTILNDVPTGTEDPDQMALAGECKAHCLKLMCKQPSQFGRIPAEHQVLIFDDINLPATPPDFFLVPKLPVVGKLLPFGFRKAKRHLRVNHTGKLLASTTFMQFIDIDVNYIRYMISSKPEYLAKMIMAIYLEGTTVYDPTALQEKTASGYDPLPLVEVCQAILYSYGAIREQIMAQYPDFWPTTTKASKSTDYPPLSGEVGEARRGRPRDLHATWHNTLVNLSQCPEYPGLAAAKAAPTHEALYVLNKRAKENKPK
jgi:hypothetical protein